MILQSPRQQAQVHDSRWRGEMQIIGRDQSPVAIGTLHKLVAETCAPLGRISDGLGNRFEMQPASIVAANLNSESVVEAEWRANRQMKPLFVFGSDALIDRSFVRGCRLLQDCGQ